jgi:hypothetical protein
MKRATTLALLLCLLLAPGVFAQADMSGEWSVNFSTPQGPQEMTMYISQEGTRLSGHFTSENGEFPLKGTMKDKGFTITWMFPDTGRMLEITFTGTIDGDNLSGSADFGKYGASQLSGMRTGQ